MSDVQYAYRYYDSLGFCGPLAREQVLEKLRSDLSTFPLIRHRLPGGAWSEWAEAEELLREVAK